MYRRIDREGRGGKFVKSKSVSRSIHSNPLVLQSETERTDITSFDEGSELPFDHGTTAWSLIASQKSGLHRSHPITSTGG